MIAVPKFDFLMKLTTLTVPVAFLIRAAQAQKNIDLLPKIEWWLDIQDPCDSATDCLGSIASLKTCVNACAEENHNTTAGIINLKIPRQSACNSTRWNIPRGGFVFDLPTEVIVPDFKISSARLIVNTFRLQEIPLWESCEANLFLRAHEKGRIDNEISGTNSELTSSATGNAEKGYFDLHIGKERNLTIPNGIGIHSATRTACVGFSPNTLFLQATYKQGGQ